MEEGQSVTFIDQIESWDQWLLLKINQSNNPFFDELMWGISSPYFGIPFYLLFAYGFYRSFGLKEAVVICGLIALTVGISDLTAKYCFKDVFERYRPTHHLILMEQLHLVNDYKGGTFGFISSHASNMFSIGIWVILLLRKKIKWLVWLVLLWALLIGYSRVYLGVHYPSDVLVGSLVGSLIAGILYYLSKQFNWIKC